MASNFSSLHPTFVQSKLKYSKGQKTNKYFPEKTFYFFHYKGFRERVKYGKNPVKNYHQMRQEFSNAMCAFNFQLSSLVIIRGLIATRVF